MPSQSEVAERLARLEAHIENLGSTVARQEAEMKETVREFRQAFENHRQEHKDEAKDAADTRWKVVSAVIGAGGIAAAIAMFFLGRAF